MSKAKAVYQFAPILDRHIFYSNCLDAAVDLIKEYYTPSSIDFKELEALKEDFKHAKGLSVMVTSKTNDEKQMCYIMNVDDSADINVVTHEATHITNYILEYVGIPLDELDDEIMAYTNGYFAEQFMINIRGYKPKQGALKKLKKNETKKTKSKSTNTKKRR